MVFRARLLLDCGYPQISPAARRACPNLLGRLLWALESEHFLRQQVGLGPCLAMRLDLC